MSISHEIAKTIGRLRCLPDIDVERLSYELSEEEWLTFYRELSALDMRGDTCDLSYADSCLFMGLTIRKRARINTPAV